jgi:hypothetical protein
VVVATVFVADEVALGEHLSGEFGVVDEFGVDVGVGIVGELDEAVCGVDLGPQQRRFVRK